MLLTVKAQNYQKKGFIWKTWEGYVILGSISNGTIDKWTFSIYNDNVKLTYKQYLIYPYRKG